MTTPCENGTSSARDGKPKIEVGDLPPELSRLRAGRASDDDEALSLAEVERRHILRVLERCGGHRQKTAGALGIATNTLWRKLREYGVAAGRPEAMPSVQRRARRASIRTGG